MRGAWLFVIGLAGCAGPQTAVPAALNVPTDEVAVLRLRGAGAQVYECKADTQDPTKHAWVLKAPDAELYDGAGMVVGKHYAGPTWESRDGSRIVGEVRARADAPDPNAIPWLLLATRSTGGAGVLSRVKSVQRLDTVGGKAPASCDTAQVGQTLRVSYSAAYVFAVNR